MENLKSILSNAMSSKQSLKTFSEHIFSQLTCCIISRDFTMTVKVNFHSHGTMMLMIHPKARPTQHQLCITLLFYRIEANRTDQNPTLFWVQQDNTD